MTRHEWLISRLEPMAIYGERKRCLDETGLDLRPIELVLERCGWCGLRRAVKLRVGATGDRWRTVAQRQPGEPWSRSRTVGACRS